MVGNRDITEFALVGESRDKPAAADWDGPRRPDTMRRRTSGHHGELPWRSPDWAGLERVIETL
jgi:hypothetical protein